MSLSADNLEFMLNVIDCRIAAVKEGAPSAANGYEKSPEGRSSGECYEYVSSLLGLKGAVNNELQFKKGR